MPTTNRDIAGKKTLKKAGKATTEKTSAVRVKPKTLAKKKNAASGRTAKTASTETKTYKFGVGSTVPKVKLDSTSGKKVSLMDYAGRFFVIYFYPKDNTSGCTLEGYDFKKFLAEFQRLDCDVVGISRDSLDSHLKFKSKCEFPFELLADTDGVLCEAFDVMQMKNMYGRKFLGIERSTFLVGKNGKVLQAWRKVKVTGHAEAVLQSLKATFN